MLDRRDAVYSDLAEYLQLRNITKKLQEQRQGQQNEELKTLVDLGCNFYAHARVFNPSHICVAVGYGFFVEFTLDEAIVFIDRKTAHLMEQAQRLTVEASEISARVKQVMGYISVQLKTTTEAKLHEQLCKKNMVPTAK